MLMTTASWVLHFSKDVLCPDRRSQLYLLQQHFNIQMVKKYEDAQGRIRVAMALRKTFAQRALTGWIQIPICLSNVSVAVLR